MSVPALSRVLTTAGLGLLASVAAAAPAAAFVPAGVSPQTLVGPGTAEFRFTIQGGDRDATTFFEPRAISARESAFGDAGSSLDITGARIEGAGTLRVDAIAMASLVPSCQRGSTIDFELTKYLLTVPARATSTVVVTAKVPPLFRGGKAGVELSYGVPMVDGQPTPAVASLVQQTVSSSSYVDGVSLRLQPSTTDRVRVSGRVSSARRSVKVTFVTRAARAEETATLAFGSPESVRTPRKGLRVVGSTRTRAGGRFSASLKMKSGVALAARTSGVHAGASCALFVPR